MIILDAFLIVFYSYYFPKFEGYIVTFIVFYRLIVINQVDNRYDYVCTNMISQVPEILLIFLDISSKCKETLLVTFLPWNGT